MARRTRSAPASREPKAWQRALATGAYLAVVTLAVLILLGADDDHTSWAKHTAGAAALLFLAGSICLGIASPRIAAIIAVVAGWLLPAALVWLGVEYWTNWHAFYSPSGHRPLTTENDARVAGSLFWVFALFAAAGWVFVTRGVIEYRRSRPDGARQA